MTAPHDLVAGRYRRERLVGSGGMGTVWEAWDELLDRRVALKELRSPLGLTPEEAELANERAMREARITARLSHRYAVPVFDVVEHEGRPCIVMPFIPAVTLSTVLREAGPLNPDEAAGVGAQIAGALAAAHAVGIVHRDVKPGNILIADDGAAMISDFGISHALGDVTLTSAGEVHGTPAYLAPEAARGGEATTASDVFSLGSTLYAAVEGAPPFGTDQNSIALLHRVAAADYPPPEQAGPLAPLLAEMLAADPADRPPMGAVASRLKALAGDSANAPSPAAGPVTAAAGPAAAAAVASEPTAPAPTDQDLVPAASDRPARRRPGRALAAVVALVVAGILAGVLWVQFGDPGGTAARDPAGAGSSSDAPPAGSGTPSDVDAPSTDTTPAPGPDGTGSAAPSASARPSTTAPSPSRAPRTTTAPEPTRTRVPESPSSEDLVAAVRSYYALMPSGTDAAWSRMTDAYRTNHAGGRSAYEQFWAKYQRVTVSNVSGQPPDRAEATITYYYKSGRVDTERTAFRFVNDDGRLKISWTDVLSSVSRGAGP
jgi:eukaryotic-like serine/threonine-protein kinase